MSECALRACGVRRLLFERLEARGRGVVEDVGAGLLSGARAGDVGLWEGWGPCALGALVVEGGGGVVDELGRLRGPLGAVLLGACDGGGGEEDGGADPELASFVPAAEVVIDPREEAGFRHTQEKASSHHALEVVREAHGQHSDAPDGHDSGNEARGPPAFEQDVRKGLEERIGDEEDGEAGIILAACDVQGLLQTVEFGVADVRPVEEGDEVEQAEPWYETKIQLPKQSSVL